MRGVSRLLDVAAAFAVGFAAGVAAALAVALLVPRPAPAVLVVPTPIVDPAPAHPVLRAAA